MEDQYIDLCHLDKRPYIDFLIFIIVQRSIRNRTVSEINIARDFFHLIKGHVQCPYHMAAEGPAWPQKIDQDQNHCGRQKQIFNNILAVP